MGISETPITRRGALAAVGAGVVIGGLGLSGAAKAATTRPVPPGAAIATMTPAQKAGQRVIFSYSGTTVPQTLLDQIAAGEAGGVIFFGGNITSLDQIAGVVTQLKEAQAASPVQSPLLIMTDQEGGEVRRLPGAPVNSEKTIGASSDPAAEAAEAGTGAGQNLAGVGMDANLAPVLGVYRQAGDFEDQYQRSYSMDPDVCAECGAAFVTAQQKLNVVATAKHFPGLGAATAAQNTDEAPVTLDLPLSELRSVDEVPFRAAIAAGVKMVMASWAIYPALDPKYPSGLSKTIIQGELRQRLGFTGVTITDALEAGAAAPFGTPAQVGVLAAQAGMDVLLASVQDPSEGQETVAAVAEALQDGTLNPGQSETALLRVLALRDSLG